MPSTPDSPTPPSSPETVPSADAAQAPAPPMVLAVLTDLFFGVKIAEAASRAGARTRFIRTQEELLGALPEGPVLAVFDLAQRELEPAALLRALRAHPGGGALPTLGFFSHVHEALRREALAAGCDEVLPRSRFATEVEGRVGAAVRHALTRH